jgi:uncharacterized protein YcbK (DUF882 family)
VVVQRLGIIGALAAVTSLALAAPQPKPGRPKPPGYKAMVDKWHSLPEVVTPAVDEAGHPLLVLRSINTLETASFPAAGAGGGFAGSALDRASLLLRDNATGTRHPVEPRLLDLVFRIEDHFHAPEIRFLSGYRLPSRGNGSNHGKGRAMDLVVPGVTDAEVAEFARTLGYVGVGIYPVSGFVHVDVRDRSYFWSDASGPGKRNRERGILGDVARSSDRDAAARGEHSVSTCAFSLDVDAALRACTAREASALDDDDDN